MWPAVKSFRLKNISELCNVQYLGEGSFLSNWGVPLLLVAVNFFLKLWYIRSQSIAGDEAFSIYTAQYDISTIVRYLSQFNNPPLFEIILHFWMKLFGLGTISMRFLPCLFSSLTVWFIYKTGTRFIGLKAGILSSLLFTLSDYEMYFAHETRVYSLFLLLTCISFYAYLNLLNSNSVKFRIIYPLSLLLLLYAHYLSFFVLLVQLLTSLFFKEIRRKLLKTFLISTGIAILGFLPMAFVFLRRFYDSTVNGTWIHPVTNLGQLHDVLKNLTNYSVTNYIIFIVIIWFVVQKLLSRVFTNRMIVYLSSLISIFFLFYGISIMGPMPRYWEFTSKIFPMTSYLLFILLILFVTLRTTEVSLQVKIIVCWFFFPLLIMFVSSFWVPMFIDRYLMFITGAFYLLLGAAICYLNGSKLLHLGLLSVMLFAITFETNVDKRRHVEEVIHKVKELKKEGTLVYICPYGFDVNFAYYYNRTYFTDIDNPETKTKLYKRLALENIYPIYSFKQIDTSMLKKARKVIYIDAAADFGCPGNRIRDFLDNTLEPQQQFDVYEIYRLREYIPKQVK